MVRARLKAFVSHFSFFMHWYETHQFVGSTIFSTYNPSYCLVADHSKADDMSDRIQWRCSNKAGRTLIPK